MDDGKIPDLRAVPLGEIPDLAAVLARVLGEPEVPVAAFNSSI